MLVCEEASITSVFARHRCFQELGDLLARNVTSVYFGSFFLRDPKFLHKLKKKIVGCHAFERWLVRKCASGVWFGFGH